MTTIVPRSVLTSVACLSIALLGSLASAADDAKPPATIPIQADGNAPKTPAGDWPCWRGPNWDNVSAEANWNPKWPEGGPKRLWKAQVGIGYSPVSVAAGRAYTMGNAGRKDTVWCFDAVTGDVLWRHTYGCTGGGAGYPGPRAQPAVDGNRVYTISIHGHLKCLDAAKGGVIWEKNVREQLGSKGSPGHGHCENPLVLGKMLVMSLGAPPASIVAFDKMTGDVLWKGGTDPAGYSTPTPYVFQGRQCLALFTGASMIGVDASDGRLLWRHPWRSNLNIAVSTPIVSGDKVFFSCDYGFGGALLQITEGEPKELWRNTSMSNHFNTCVLWKGHLYGFTPKGSHSVSEKTVLRCLEFSTGKVMWESGGLGIGTLMVANVHLILLGDAGDLVIAEATAEGYKPISRAKVLESRCWTVPVLAGGRIYCRDEKGVLVCLDVTR